MECYLKRYDIYPQCNQCIGNSSIICYTSEEEYKEHIKQFGRLFAGKYGEEQQMEELFTIHQGGFL